MGYKDSDDCLENAADDEPIFVLRAQDNTAPATIQFWLSQNPDLPNAKLKSVRELLGEMYLWQADPKNFVKSPD